MDSEKLKNQLGANIAMYRKEYGLTQAALAEKLNFSDKAVSKWERGESMPDVPTLVHMAQLFNIPVDILLKDPDELPADIGSVERAMGKAVEKTLKRKADKKIIQKLSSLIVWFVALLIFVICSSADVPYTWVSFFYAIPANAIVLLCLRSAWHDFRRNRLLISVLMWGALLSLYMTLLLFVRVNVWKLFLLGIPGQIAIYLWFRMFRKPVGEEKHG